MKSSVSEPLYNIIHGSFMTINLIGFAWYCSHIHDIHFLIKFFSVQSFELAILYSIVSMFKSARESRWTQILYELSFTYNIITCLGYWLVARPAVVHLISDEFLLCNDFTHTMPILMMILIHYVQKLQYFHRQNLKYQIYLMVIATTINVFYTFWDKPVYIFMTYEDITTGIFLVGGFIMITLIFLGMAKVTQIRSKTVKTA